MRLLHAGDGDGLQGVARPQPQPVARRHQGRPRREPLQVRHLSENLPRRPGRGARAAPEPAMKKLTTVEIDGYTSDVWVEVPENEPVAWPPEAELAVLGRPLPRVDAYEKDSGHAKYTHDLTLPHMLWTKTLRSPTPHAKIVSIDTSKAEALPGVKLVLTHKNAPDIPWYAGRSQLFDTTPPLLGQIRKTQLL